MRMVPGGLAAPTAGDTMLCMVDITIPYTETLFEGMRERGFTCTTQGRSVPVAVWLPVALSSSRGNGPALHAHDYPEIFIPIRSSFFVDYGKSGQHRVELGVYDAFSLPLNVLRKFEAFETAPQESQMLSIFDTAMDDARAGIKISPEVAAADAAAGMPQEFAVSDDLVDATPEQVQAKHIARFHALQAEDAHVHDIPMRRCARSTASKSTFWRWRPIHGL